MLLTYNDVADPDVLEDVLNLLSDTQWFVLFYNQVVKLVVKPSFLPENLL